MLKNDSNEDKHNDDNASPAPLYNIIHSEMGNCSKVLDKSLQNTNKEGKKGNTDLNNDKFFYLNIIKVPLV